MAEIIAAKTVQLAAGLGEGLDWAMPGGDPGGQGRQRDGVDGDFGDPLRLGQVGIQGCRVGCPLGSRLCSLPTPVAFARGCESPL